MDKNIGNNEITAELKAAYIKAAIDRAKRAEPLRRLRMRLKYAEYKVRQGWSTNTLDEVSMKYSQLCTENKKKRPEIYDMNKHFFTDLIRESGDSTLNNMIGPDTRRSASPYFQKTKPVREGVEKPSADRSPPQGMVTRRKSANQSSHETVEKADFNVPEGNRSSICPKVSPSVSPTVQDGQASIGFSKPSPEIMAAELILSFRRGSSASRSTISFDCPTDTADGQTLSASPTSESSEDPVKTEPEPQTQLIPAMQTQAPQYIYGNQLHQHSQYGHISPGSVYPRGLNLIAGAAGIV